MIPEGMMTITVSYHEGEPEIAFIFPETCGEESKLRIQQCFAFVHGLIEQCYTNMGVWEKQSQAADVKKTAPDVNVR